MFKGFLLIGENVKKHINLPLPREIEVSRPKISLHIYT
jgi:hypothetical protein